MSYSEIEIGEVPEQQDKSTLYAIVNMENKTNRQGKKTLEKRISNKYEFIIPTENSELSSSDTNLHSTHESKDSLLSSRSLFGSADDIICDKSLENGTTYDSGLMRHNTGTFSKVRAPPPAIPPPYQLRGDYEVVQTQTNDSSPFRRSKSINSKSQLQIVNDSNLKLEFNNKAEIISNGLTISPRRLVQQSFRLHNEGKPKHTPGLIMSLPTKPAMRPPRIPIPFKAINSPPVSIIPQRKPSPPDNNNKQPFENNNNKKPSENNKQAFENNNKQSSDNNNKQPFENNNKQSSDNNNKQPFENNNKQPFDNNINKKPSENNKQPFDDNNNKQPFVNKNKQPSPILTNNKQPSEKENNNKQLLPTLNNNEQPSENNSNNKQTSPTLNNNKHPFPGNNNKQPSPENNNKHPHPSPENNNKQTSPENNNKHPSPENNNNIITRRPSPLQTPPLPLPKPCKSLPTPPMRPNLKPHITPNTLTQHSQLRKQVPLSPPPVKPAKPPARLPPPPPAHSLTLPRKVTPPKSPSIGDYTVLTPVSPDASPVDCPAFSPLLNAYSDSTLNDSQNLITDEGYTILNVDEIQANSDEKPKINPLTLKELKPLEFRRVGSSPLITDNSNIIPPKKPPRLLTATITTPAVNNDSDYAILSTLESSDLSHNNIPSAKDNSDCNKTKTLPIKARIPPKPQAYRNRSQSQTIGSCIAISPNSSNLINSVEVKPETKKNGDSSSEGNIFSKVFQKSKRTKGKDRGESTTPTISSPILGTHNATKVIGLNPLLISECLTYLKQCKCLREEGIFRVPGDLNQIKIYHNQFDYSMNTNLDEELDPNTISSLLKQHIRDNGGLLPKRDAGDLFTAVRQKNVEEIRTVINRMPAELKNILKDILLLFREVSEHYDDNKMCAGAIATSCGLSIFPTVNAGNANLMLKSLIDHFDKVFI